MKKNYIILFLIYLITIISVLYFVFLYKKSTSIIDYDSSINMFVINVSDKNYDKLFENINNYLFENNNFIVFISSNNNINENLKRIIIDYNLDKEFLYIDNENTSIINRLIKDFSNNQYSNIQNNEQTLIYFSNGKITDIKTCSDMSYSNLKNYFSKMGMI